MRERRSVLIEGKGFKGLTKPSDPLRCRKLRYTCKIDYRDFAAQDFETTIIGDKSLSSRPMKRIIVPLTSMGAKMTATPDSTLPLKIFPSEKLNPIRYELPVASAHVKSAVLLAGLHIDETTTVVEQWPSRNHTEKMLGLKTEVKDGKYYSYVSKKNYPGPKELFCPRGYFHCCIFHHPYFIVKRFGITDQGCFSEYFKNRNT